MNEGYQPRGTGAPHNPPSGGSGGQKPNRDYMINDHEAYLKRPQTQIDFGSFVSPVETPTLRDQMAMVVLPLFLNAFFEQVNEDGVSLEDGMNKAIHLVAQYSYKLSDAMMEASKKGGAA